MSGMLGWDPKKAGEFSTPGPKPLTGTLLRDAPGRALGCPTKPKGPFQLPFIILKGKPGSGSVVGLRLLTASRKLLFRFAGATLQNMRTFAFLLHAGVSSLPASALRSCICCFCSVHIWISHLLSTSLYVLTVLRLVS